MHLLQSGVPFNVIALWLGHESMNTTHRYVEANMAMKEKALARLESPNTKIRRFRAPDALMRLLQSLQLCAGGAGIHRATTLGASADDLQHLRIVAIST
jgi:hypothetical protein